MGTIVWTPGSGRRSIITDEVKRVMEQQMRMDDETTTSQLHDPPGILSQPENYFMLQDINGVDLQRISLLPAHT